MPIVRVIENSFIQFPLIIYTFTILRESENKSDGNALKLSLEKVQECRRREYNLELVFRISKANSKASSAPHANQKIRMAISNEMSTGACFLVCAKSGLFFY